MKQVTLYIGAFDFTALRCIFGAVLLFIVLFLRGRGMRPTPFGYTLAIALLQTCGMIGLAQWALMSGGAGRVAILTYTMPFWVVILAAVLLGERMRRRQYAALVMSAVAMLVPQRPIDWQPGVFWALGYSAILATALAWSLWLYVLRNLPASIASLSTLAVPVFGVLFSWWLLGERPDGVESLGIALIVFALAMISLKKRVASLRRSR